MSDYNKAAFLDPIMDGELYDLLTGQKGYKIPNRFIATPTDPSIVFESLMSVVKDNPEIPNLLLREVNRMADDPEFFYLVIYYLINIQRNAEKFRRKFDLVEFRKSILEKVTNYKEVLILNKTGQGAHNPEGWWGIISRKIKTTE